MNGRAGMTFGLALVIAAARCAAQGDPSAGPVPPTVGAPPPVVYTVPAGHSIWVDKGRQRVYAFDGNQLIISVRCSTAAHYKHWAAGEGRYLTPSTPLGDYQIFSKTPDHWSRTYQVHMRYAMFYDGGRAIHATTSSNYRMLGHPASGGCVRVTKGHAIALYGWAQIGDPVHVVRSLPDAYLAVVNAYQAPVQVTTQTTVRRVVSLRHRRRHTASSGALASAPTAAVQPPPVPTAPATPIAHPMPVHPTSTGSAGSHRPQPVTPGSGGGVGGGTQLLPSP